MSHNHHDTPRQFSSLAEIEEYKAELIGMIHDSEQDISSLWDKLFQKSDTPSVKTPTQRIMSMVHMGSGVLDGLILGWKLYRKFRKPAQSLKTRRR